MFDNEICYGFARLFIISTGFYCVFIHFDNSLNDALFLFVATIIIIYEVYTLFTKIVKLWNR